MSVRSRQTKVLAALLVSIAVGAIILKVLGSNPPSAGAFCLSGYYRLDPVEKSILSQAAQHQGRWSHIAIYYSSTDALTNSSGAATCGSNRSIPAPRSSMLSTGRLSADTRRESKCHFIVCNGRAGHDGQILPTENWQRQCPIIPEPNSLLDTRCSMLDTRRSMLDSERTIYISVITPPCFLAKARRGAVRNSTMDNMIQKEKISNGARPTDFQIKRTEALAEELSRMFNIRPESIHYPDNWQ